MVAESFMSSGPIQGRTNTVVRWKKRKFDSVMKHRKQWADFVIEVRVKKTSVPEWYGEWKSLASVND
jgi:hypothetical protein